MTQGTQRIVIAGAGGIGQAVGLLLAAWGDVRIELALGDAVADRAVQAADWLRQALGDRAVVRPFHLPVEGTNEELDRELAAGAILLDCLPGSQAPRMARLALAHDLHYANLTEYVAETREVVAIADGASRGFLLQTGLAPGFVNVLGHQLFLDFCRDHRVERIETLRMRVGALPVCALPPHYYAFTWSPVGVATEYLEDSIIVRDGEKTSVPSLTGIDTVRLGSMVLEEAVTSGGAADLPDALAGRVEQLSYKTLRHPGHWSWVRGLLEEIDDRGHSEAARITALQAAMEHRVPAVEDDQVVIYASATGRDAHGVRRRKEELLVVEPQEILGRRLRAIQLTTAAGLAESARLLLTGSHSGPVLQSQIEPTSYLAGPFIRRAYYGD